MPCTPGVAAELPVEAPHAHLSAQPSARSAEHRLNPAACLQVSELYARKLEKPTTEAQKRSNAAGARPLPRLGYPRDCNLATWRLAFLSSCLSLRALLPIPTLRHGLWLLPVRDVWHLRAGARRCSCLGRRLACCLLCPTVARSRERAAGHCLLRCRLDLRAALPLNPACLVSGSAGLQVRRPAGGLRREHV